MRSSLDETLILNASKSQYFPIDVFKKHQKLKRRIQCWQFLFIDKRITTTCIIFLSLTALDFISINIFVIIIRNHSIFQKRTLLFHYWPRSEFLNFYFMIIGFLFTSMFVRSSLFVGFLVLSHLHPKEAVIFQLDCNEYWLRTNIKILCHYAVNTS